MPAFKYLAKDGVKNVEGVVDAQSRDEAIGKINQKGYVPVKIEEAAGTIQSKFVGLRGYAAKVKSKDITIFSRQLASLIKSGVPILRSLQIICKQSGNPSFKKVLDDVYLQVKEGQSLSDALEKYSKIFPPIFIAMMRSGETSGTLQEVLVRISDYRQKQEKIISQVRTALAYPVLMAVVGFGTIFFMITFVMPRLMRIFDRMGQDLPLPTQILIKISTGIQQWWVVIVIGLVVFAFTFKKISRTKTQRMILSRLKLRLPVFGNFVQKSELARFSRTLELLIRSNISILQAIKVAIPILENETIRMELLKCLKDLEEGGSFGKSLEKSKLFPGFMTSLIMVGEESGRLDEALDEIASSYERDIDEAVKVLTSLIEPLMILVMGLIVGLIVIAMLLPIFQMNMMAT